MTSDYLIQIRIFGGKKHGLKNLVREVRQKYNLSGKRPVPHITLVGPIETDDESRLISDFENICRDQEEVMTYEGLEAEMFGDSRVVYAKIRPNEALREFRLELSRELRDYCELSEYDYADKGEFQYHCSIERAPDQKKLGKIFGHVAGRKELEFRHLAMRATLLKNRKILREYDFFLDRTLTRSEGKDDDLLSESFEAMEKYRKENLVFTEEARVGEVPTDDTASTPSENLEERVFFIGDLHLDHYNIIRYCDRPFDKISEMNDTILKRWNEAVDENDVVYFLGDLTFGRGGRITDYWLDKLNGNIVVIKGNHDETRREFLERLILHHDDGKFLLTHGPDYIPSWWDGWAIHGHKHNNDLDNYPLVNEDKKTINVGAELLDYRPISLRDLLSKIEEKASSWLPF